MANLSNLIEAFIKQLLTEGAGNIELQRNMLANKFNCVPSQINYVIGTRFTNDKGYYVESKRGGGGHITIRRINMSHDSSYLMHIIMCIGGNISQQSAEIFINNFVDYEAITERDAKLMAAAVSDKVIGGLGLPTRDIVRAMILKNMLAGIM